MLIGAAVIAALGGILVTLGYASLVRRSSADAELADLCKSVWVIAQRHTTIPFDKIGVHVWAVRGVLGARYLDRRASFIPEARRSTPITWRKAKGAIGLAWAEDSTLVADVERLEEEAPTEAMFNALEPSERYGLSWHEYREARQYRAILAVPLRQARWGRFRVRGCLSVDLRLDGRANELDNLAARDDFGAVLSVCEAILVRGRP